MFPNCNITPKGHFHTSQGEFFMFIDEAGGEMYCPNALIETAKDILTNHPWHAVIIEYDASTMQPTIGHPVYGFHLLDHATGKTVISIRVVSPDNTINGLFAARVYEGDEAQQVFTERLGYTADQMLPQIQQCVRNGKGKTMERPMRFEIKAEQLDLQPKPLQTSIKETSPLYHALHNRDYAALTLADREKDIEELLLVKKALETVLITQQIENAYEQAVKLFNAKITFKEVNGQLTPHIGKYHLVKALSNRMRCIINSYKGEEFDDLIEDTRERGISYGMAFPDEPHQLLMDSQDLLGDG